MSEHERHDFVRSEEKYDTRTLCAYVRDILLTQGEESGQEGRIAVSWDSDLASVHLMSETLEAERSVFQMEVHDHNTIDHRRIYMLNQQAASITIYNDLHQRMPSDTPQEIIVQLMQYLRTCPDVREPLISDQGEELFQRIAASIAIQQAIESNTIDMKILSTACDTDFGPYLCKSAAEAVATEGVETEEGKLLPFTHSTHYIKYELSWLVRNMYQYRDDRSLPPGHTSSLPPDDDIDSL